LRGAIELIGRKIEELLGDVDLGGGRRDLHDLIESEVAQSQGGAEGGDGAGFEAQRSEVNLLGSGGQLRGERGQQAVFHGEQLAVDDAFVLLGE
jgi:hypothetical protein